MPNRIIHEKACNSLTLDAVSDGAERLFWRLMTKADDYGRFDADERVLLGSCFPLRIGRMTPARVGTLRDELDRAGAIMLYWVADRLYGSFCAWDRHQRKRESKPKYPDPAMGRPYASVAANGGELPQVAAYARAGVSGVGSRESRDVSREAATQATDGEAPSRVALALPPHESNGFHIPEPISRALERAVTLGQIRGFRRLCEDTGWWRAQIQAHRSMDLAACVSAAESWLMTYPARAAKKRDAVKFLYNWFKEEETRG